MGHEIKLNRSHRTVTVSCAMTKMQTTRKVDRISGLLTVWDRFGNISRDNAVHSPASPVKSHSCHGIFFK